MQRRPLGQGIRKATNTVAPEHKYRLKRRLDRAYKASSIDSAEPRGRGGTHAHQEHKPDPLRPARQQQRRQQEQREAEQARRDAEIAAALARRQAAQTVRREQQRKMTARTRKGQPVMRNQIDSLLARIQKDM